MRMSPICILGIGSPHGDDQAGWLLIDRLRNLIGSKPQAVLVEKICTPPDILALLKGGEELILVDACQSAAEPGRIHCLRYPDSQIAERPARFGHTVSLQQSLELAASTGLAPALCEIWCVEGIDFRPQALVSPLVSQAVDELLDLLVQRLKIRGTLHA
jgi:hydrogenase maturation protease